MAMTSPTTDSDPPGAAQPADAEAPRCAATSLRGFTLPEVLVVMTIIAIIMAFVITVAPGVRNRNRQTATKAQMDILRIAIERFKEAYGHYPPDRLIDIPEITEDDDMENVADLLRVMTNPVTPSGYYDHGNGNNEGIKALMICLTIEKRGGPFIDINETFIQELEPVADYFYHLEISENANTAPMYMAIDAWGNPFQYDRPYDAASEEAVDNAAVDVPNPAPLSILHNQGGDAHFARNRGSYDLWSWGPDGENNCAGEVDADEIADLTPGNLDDGDDVTNWRTRLQ